jgi:integrase
VKLQASVLKLLADYRDAQTRERDPGIGDVAAADLIFVNSSGNPLNERNLVQRNFQVILERAKLPHIRLYDLRHTAATLALGAGVPAKVVSEQLGHASVAFTLDTYSHVLPHMQEAAAARVEALLFEPSPKKQVARKRKRATTHKTTRKKKMRSSSK